MVRVSKKGDFAHFGSYISETKRARRSKFAAFDRSCRDLFAYQFLLQLVSKHGRNQIRC